MAGKKAISKDQYCGAWRNEAHAVLNHVGGAVAGTGHNWLYVKMQATVDELCKQIDAVGDVLEKQGLFKGDGS